MQKLVLNDSQGLVTIEEKAQKKNDVKARSMLLMALSNEHLMTFNQYKDAKTFFAAIQTRFVVIDKPQKVSEDNLMHRNKPDLDIMSFDDLYNNFKIVEQEVKGTASSSTSSQNMAFVSSPGSTNEVNTAYGVSTANTQVSPASTQVSTASTQDLVQIHEDDIEEMDLKWQLALLSMKTKRECKGPRNQDSRNKNQDSSRKNINVEETSSKAMVAIDGAGFDWSYMSDGEVPTNTALMAFLDSEPEFEGYGPKTSKSVSEYISNEVRETPDALMVKELVSDDNLEKKTVSPTVAKIEFVRPKQQEKPVRKPVKYAEMYRSQSSCNNQRKVESRNNYTRVNYNYFAKKTHPSAHKNIVPRAVLMKTGLKAVNTARPIQVSDDLGNMSYLSDFKEFDRGYVTFGGGAKGGKITGKGTLKTGKLDFEDVYFVKELHFNLFSVSQMCDKKNSVLFTDTRCFVLSPDFKLADESQVLLKVPRKNNIYSVDMKNIVPKECLTCLVAKATLDESMLWHRRLGHVQKSVLVKISSLIDSTSMNASLDELEPSCDAEKNDDEGVSKASGVDDQERPETSTPNINIDGPSINTASANLRTGSLHINITKGMTKTINEQGLLSVAYERKPHENHNITVAMQEELYYNLSFKRLGSCGFTKGKKGLLIVKMDIFRNKKDKRGIVIRNKARLVAQGYTQEEGIDYDEVFAPVARIEAIRLFLAYASFMGFMVLQMDVKSAFLYGQIEDEVYVCQPLGFEDPNYPDKVYKVVKTLYGLHQAPRA
ncbi:ribonuclease H-like domain-containing protein [Tanacetum coccineum]